MTKDITVDDAEALIQALLGDNESAVTLDELEDFSFTLLKAIAVVRKEQSDKEKTFGY